MLPLESRSGSTDGRGYDHNPLQRSTMSSSVELDSSFLRPRPSASSVTAVTKDLRHAQRAFEHMQTELFLQSRRQDEMFDCIARVEADLVRVARLSSENEGLHRAERQQRQQALASLTRRTEDALLTCESLRKGQEHLVHRVDRLEALAEDGDRVADEAHSVKREVDSLQSTVRERLDTVGHVVRRLDAMEQVFDENTRLRHEVAQLRRACERRDLELAAVQGQIDALTKLVRAHVRDSSMAQSPPHSRGRSSLERVEGPG